MSNKVTTGSGLSSILVIGGNEFKKVILDPLSIVVFILLMLLVCLEGLRSSSTSGLDGGFIASLINGLYPIGQFFAAVAIFLGVTSLAEERSRHSMSILLTKPLYRRDVILGKLLGLNLFLVLFIFSIYFAYSIVLFALVGTPSSMMDFLLRCASLVLAMFLESSLAMGIAMLAGVVFKNVLQAAIAGVTFFFIVWYSALLTDLGSLSPISPFMLLFQIIMGNSNTYQLLDPSTSYMTWLNNAIPYIVLLILEILVIITLDCMIFVRREEA